MILRMLIALENKSTHVSDADLALIAKALTIQCLRDFCPAWGLEKATVISVPKGHAPQGADAVIVQYDTIDEPDALGFHTDDQGRYVGALAATPVLDNGGSALGDPAHPEIACVASVASHEVCELLADPTVNRWLDCGRPITVSGVSFLEVALEVCDPVEGDSVVIVIGGKPILVSNFILPAWGDPLAISSSQMDFLGKLHSQFSMDAGGYMVVRSEINGGQQIFGDMMPEWKKNTKQRSGRGAKRILLSP